MTNNITCCYRMHLKTYSCFWPIWIRCPTLPLCGVNLIQYPLLPLTHTELIEVFQLLCSASRAQPALTRLWGICGDKFQEKDIVRKATVAVVDTQEPDQGDCSWAGTRGHCLAEEVIRHTFRHLVKESEDALFRQENPAPLKCTH